MKNETSQDDLDAQLLAAMRADFLEESEEHLAILDQTLVLLEQNPENAEHVEDIFRRIHTVKGTASFTGLNEINLIAHLMEDILSVIRTKKTELGRSLFDLLFDGLSWLKKLRTAALGGQKPPSVDSIAHRLKAAFKDLREKDPQKSPALALDKKDSGGSAAETLRIPTLKLDAIMNLAGELIISKNKLSQYSKDTDNRPFAELCADIQRVSVELHREIVEARLVPISSLFNLFHGVVRNSAVKKSKKARLSISGAETLLDKKIKELLYNPFVHIVQNALDHGIESPAEREKAGKNPEGKIEISALRKGNNIEITVSDDGKGIDLERVAQKAVQTGLATPQEVEGMSRADKLDLIFHHGFSTADQVTTSSGRGVGMDVVKRDVTSLRGIIRVESEKGKGTTFSIQVPMSMSLTKSLVVKERGIPIAVPFESIIETAVLRNESIVPLLTKKKKTLPFQDRHIPLLTLPDVFQKGFFPPIQLADGEKSDPAAAEIEMGMRENPFWMEKERFPIVVIGLANCQIALVVEEMLGTEELIQKPLNEFIGPVKGIEGSALLPDGAIALFLDVRTLADYV